MIVDTTQVKKTTQVQQSERLAITKRLKKFATVQAVLGLVLASVFTLTLEHSPLDVAISQYFYSPTDGWLLAKQSLLPNLIFYTIPKRLLIVFEVYLAIAWLQRYLQSLQSGNWFAKKATWFQPFNRLSLAEIGYLVVAMVLVPSITASLKAVTHVVCPNHLQIFGGEYAYLSILENIQLGIRSKCFPAAHASAGFALYAWAFVPMLWQKRWWVAAVVTLLAWLMGGYKMLIGDHFFSHTMVSMCLAWGICASVAWFWWRAKVNR